MNSSLSKHYNTTNNQLQYTANGVQNTNNQLQYIANGVQNYLSLSLNKQNCLSLSNQSDSLLVTSTIRQSQQQQQQQYNHYHKNDRSQQENKKSKIQHKFNNSQCNTKNNKNKNGMLFFNLTQNNRNKLSSVTIVANQKQSHTNQTNFINNMNRKDKQIQAKSPLNIPSDRQSLLVNTQSPMLISKQSRQSSYVSCKQCRQQVGLIKQRLCATVHRIEQLQSMLKICFAKTLSTQTTIKQNNNQIVKLQIQLQSNQLSIQHHDEILIKSNTNKSVQSNSVNDKINQLSQILQHKTKQLNEVICLQNSLLNQKIQTMKLTNEQRCQELIRMVQQLCLVKETNQRDNYNSNNSRSLLSAKTVHNKNNSHHNRYNSCNSNKHKGYADNRGCVDFDITQQLKKYQLQPQQQFVDWQFVNPKNMIYNNINSHTHRHGNYQLNRQKKIQQKCIQPNRQRNLQQSKQKSTQHNQQKSKISYYLSKSNFNDNTLSQTMIHPLQTTII